MGATPEVKDEVQDELSAALEASRKPGEVTEEPEPEPEVEATKEEPSEKPKEEKPAEEVKDEAKPDKREDILDVEEQNRELRQILRQQKRDMAIMQAKLSRLEKRSVEATKKAEAEVEEDDLFGSPKEKSKEPAKETADEVAPVEYVQQELLAIARAKGPILETLLETMELSPSYSDVREVCSQSNFDDIFEAVGSAIAEKEGKDVSLAALEAEAAVWKMPNPYKYMYGLIKKYHPKYADRQPAKREADEKPVKKDSGKKPAEAPSSIAGVSGKSVASNAWTAARIDEMDELELHKVPSEIYEKYLRGDLD